MIKQNIIIIGHKVLYDILQEIESYLLFEIIYFINEDKYLKSLIINKENTKNSIYLFKKNTTKLLKKIKLNENQIFDIPDQPIEIFKLIEKINIKLIRQKYSNQSNVPFGKYLLDVNSREISRDNKTLKLTEKEIDTIIFLNNSKSPQSTKDLLNKVWGYIADIETHTVETHIYRLRKKILEKFDDKNFIMSHEEGYKIL